MRKNSRVNTTSEYKGEDKADECGFGTQIRSYLHGCSTANLYKLLQSKKVPLRSKLKTKTARIEALIPILTPSELTDLGFIPESEIPPESRKTPISEGMGQRKDYPVMGIDVHRDTLVWAIADVGGISEEGTVLNDEIGIKTLLNVLYRYTVGAVAMESTAELWIPLYWALADAGIPALVANPAQTKETQGKKTDVFDARRIVLAFRDGRLKPSVICDREEFALRKNMRLLGKEIHLLTSVKNRLNQIFRRADPTNTIRTYLKSRRGQYILQKCADCSDFKSLFEIICVEFSSGRGKTANQSVLTEYTNNLLQFLNNLEKNYDSSRFFILISEFLEREANIHQLERQGLLYAGRHPQFLKNLKILLSVPGVDIRSGIIILSEIVDIKFFPNPKGLTKWAGLVPKTIQSGYKKRKTGRLHKAGNKYLRRVLWTVAQFESTKPVSSKYPFREFLLKLKQNKKLSWKGAIIGGARKMLVLIHHLLTNQEFYESNDNEGKTPNKKIQQSSERKVRKLDRMLEKMPEEEVFPIIISRLKSSWVHNCKEFEAFELLCDQVLDKRLNGRS